MLYSAAGQHGPTWSLWRKHPRNSRATSRILELGYRGSEAHDTCSEKEILAAHKGVGAASEAVGREAQPLLAPQC